jgi:hypothetical protein
MVEWIRQLDPVHRAQAKRRYTAGPAGPAWLGWGGVWLWTNREEMAEMGCNADGDGD